jgi:sugar phosphate isomerase/epimerase
MDAKFQFFKEYGFEFIHWCDDWNTGVFYTHRDIERFRQLLDSAGLQCLDVHGTATSTISLDSLDAKVINRYIQLLENRIEFCAAVGGDAVVVHPPNAREESDTLDSGLSRSLRVFEQVQPLCEELGVVLAIENCFPSDETILNYYFETYPVEFIGFCFDSGHAHVHNNFENLVKYADRLKVLHLNDNKGETDDHQPPFWGSINWGNVIRWIRESPYTKPITFEIIYRLNVSQGSMEAFMEYTLHAIQKVLAS